MILRVARRASRGALGGIACLLVAGAGAFAARGAPSKGATSHPSFSADPTLAPGFKWGLHDYVIRCHGDPVKVSVKTPGDWLGKVGSGGFHQADFVARRSLMPGRALRVTFHRPGHRYRRFYARCLPSDFPVYHFARTGAGGPSFFIIQNTYYAAIFDRHGVPVWWYKATTSPNNAGLLPDGTLAWDLLSPGVLTGDYEIRTLNGRLVRVVKAVGGPTTDIHDLQLLPNGNYLLAAQVIKRHVDTSQFGGSSDASVTGFQIQEVTPSGELAWKWNSLSHIGLSQTPMRWWSVVLGQSEPYDIQHWNSLDADGKFLLLSFRHDDAVYLINRRTGGVVWKLGGTPTPKSLEVLNDPEGSYPLGAQHDARRLPDGTVSIHDNATGLGKPPRVVRYRIDPQARTARLVESISDPDAAQSPCCGSARQLPSGGWLVGWGGIPFIGAYDSAGQRLFKLDIPDGFSYRAFPVPPHALSAARLRHGMNVMNR